MILNKVEETDSHVIQSENCDLRLIPILKTVQGRKEYSNVYSLKSI